MTNSQKNSSHLTPLMKQFYDVKEQHPDKILFFRMGDFYEMFGDDAIKAAPILGIALTSRSHGNSERIPLAGVPYHASDKYLAKLLNHGEKVVVVEQVEDPKTVKGLVKREIVEILTPGTATIDSPEMDNNQLCLASIYKNNNNKIGMAALDISTGSFIVDEGNLNEISERLKVMEASEILYPSIGEKSDNISEDYSFNGLQNLTPFEEWNFDYQTANRELNQKFGTSTLDGFGLRDNRLAITAAGAILRYLKENHRDKIDHINKISKFNSGEQMTMDYSTVRNLELIKNVATSTEENSLFSVVNRCRTAGGSRLLKNAILHPFVSKVRIERRLTGVTEFVSNQSLRMDIREITKKLPDIEKLAGRMGIGKLNPRQMLALKDSLVISKEIKTILQDAHSPHLSRLRDGIDDTDEIISKISDALTEEPPLVANKGNIFQKGYSTELDELNDSIKDARLYISSLQQKEKERTGINTLKVGFNKVFGYYLEISKANASNAPDEYIRKQTLVNAERFITPELKEKEELIFSAEEKIFKLEADLYQKLLQFLNSYIATFLNIAYLLAEIDLTASLAELAMEKKYSRPELYEDNRLKITNGRHPVIESVLPFGSFVANDINFGNENDYIHILTGPNMSGKSTYLRQIGLIVILAQIGSYVPADKAEIGLTDRVFTRVGALDNLARGQSTFLVEMVETANIMHNATEKSLVLLDEVGRGTSTFDGLSIAWAVVEYIVEEISTRTIFATHYHELTGMSEIYNSVKNFQVAVKKWEDKVIFLHQIIPGGCDDSYGIEVARLAGLPRSSINRAKQVLKLLESGKFNQSELGKGIYKEKIQPSLFDPTPSEVEKIINESDIDNMTPIEALNLLRKLKEKLL
ncbi:MAG: DNA mismatch repair protein MutS [candidate division Zixibacteria bacterium]|nr:DNA mismatch repair protein MutS [candidate division Zixibacteria bacterium]